MKLPITLCLFTSTKGHFGNDTYRETITNLFNQIPASYWHMCLAHIKWEDGQENKRDEMRKWLEEKGFIVFNTCQKWSHHDTSHQTGYMSDVLKLVSRTNSPFYLHMEDDFLFSSPSLIDAISDATRILSIESNIVQARFPRYTNEYERILGLRSKHGIDAKVEWDGLGGLNHSDWSNNPFVARPRDVNAALRFVFASNLPRHSEHGFGIAMKMLSDSDKPFYTPSADKVRVGHIGVRTPEERDDLTKPFIAT